MRREIELALTSGAIGCGGSNISDDAIDGPIIFM
jgi:hypothetical protein